MKRRPSRELLDSDAGTPTEIAASLADLSRINRWFGGVPVMKTLIAKVAETLGERSQTLLDVAAGRGDVARASAQRLRKGGYELFPTLLDRSVIHLSHASKEMGAVAGDATSLPFNDSSFDLVSCCLFAHHLDEGELVSFVNEALRVCRRAVLINDIVRNPVHLALTYLGYPLYGSRLTRNDGPASVRQAYTTGEMKTLLGQTRAARIEISHHYLFRMGVIAWKQ